MGNILLDLHFADVAAEIVLEVLEAAVRDVL
jgi:hypothetical protein